MLRRTERLISSRFLYPTTCISIHAPTNGATYSYVLSTVGITISIHAPTNGATFQIFFAWCNQINFNPRSDERSDISSYTHLIAILYFNPRSDERSDMSKKGLRTSSLNFNPRSDERSDSWARCCIRCFWYFNPRSDEGSDLIYVLFVFL